MRGNGLGGTESTMPCASRNETGSRSAADQHLHSLALFPPPRLTWSTPSISWAIVRWKAPAVSLVTTQPVKYYLDRVGADRFWETLG